MTRPAAEANKVTKLLDAVLPTEERFPVDIANVALEYSKQTSPEDPITKIKAVDLDGFEGGLDVSPKKDKWAILYNANAIEGRQRFTMAHEFGHYLLHRKKYPEGIKCSEEDYRHWGSEENQIEVEANEFAATLLMPLNDFRNQIDANTPVTYELLSQCSERYGTSYTATASRWIGYTSTRSIVVASREGYILWARSSRKALKTRAYFKTSNRSPIGIPAASQASTQGFDGVKVIEHPKGSWLQYEHCTEIALSSRAYDMTISILQLHPHNVNYIERY
jgi:Zn-dependent peptidase ImmA (M78 family)